MTPVLTRRRDAAQATLDKFRDQPFKWGVRDCSRVVAHHLRLMGHSVRLPPAGSYGSLLGAKRKLRDAGYASLAEALDAMGFERIAPAAALVGDIIQWPSETELDALAVMLTNGRIAAYHQDALGLAVLQPVEFIAAWRVEPV